MHFTVQQKPTQHCKATIRQFSFFKKKALRLVDSWSGDRGPRGVHGEGRGDNRVGQCGCGCGGVGVCVCVCVKTENT